MAVSNHFVIHIFGNAGISGGAYRNRTDVHGFATACVPNNQLFLLVKIKVCYTVCCSIKLANVRRLRKVHVLRRQQSEAQILLDAPFI
jgi:hypothetical protein